MKIIIVDDNEQVRLLLRDYLPPSFDEIYECSDGREAFSFFKKYRPDWVLMDWEMPQMNVVSAIRLIMAEFPTANICVVTAFDDEEIRREALSVGSLGSLGSLGSPGSLGSLGSLVSLGSLGKKKRRRPS